MAGTPAKSAKNARRLMSTSLQSGLALEGVKHGQATRAAAQ